jgi:hypothetical protein
MWEGNVKKSQIRRLLRCPGRAYPGTVRKHSRIQPAGFCEPKELHAAARGFDFLGYLSPVEFEEQAMLA